MVLRGLRVDTQFDMRDGKPKPSPINILARWLEMIDFLDIGGCYVMKQTLPQVLESHSSFLFRRLPWQFPFVFVDRDEHSDLFCARIMQQFSDQSF